jgi:small GTP-binding protein
LGYRRTKRFRTITKTYYKGAHGIILTYDVTNYESFVNIGNWIKQIESNAQSTTVRVLVGNKCDKPDKKVKTEEGQKVADEYNMKLFEVSAKTNKNINEVFDYLTMEILKNIDKVEDLKSEALVKDKKKKRGCCK